MTDIRPIAETQKGPLLALVRPYLAEIAPDMDPPGPNFLARIWREDGRSAWGLHDPGLNGFALTRRIAPGLAEISEFYISPDLRGQGHGTRLAHHVLTRQPGRWVLGYAATGRAFEFWQSCLAACPSVVHIRRGPPLTRHQRGSLHFIVKELSQ